MTDCKTVYEFLSAVNTRNVTNALPPEDLAQLQQFHIIQVLTTDQYNQTAQQVQSLAAEQQQIQAELGQRAQRAAQVQEEARRTHSIMFHLESHEKRDAELARQTQDQTALQAENQDLMAREQRFNQLVGMKSLLDTLVQFPGGYVGLTGFGALQTRDLGIRLYRVSDLPFTDYWGQTQAVLGELNGIADRSGQFVAGLAPPLQTVERPELWSIAIGLAKQPGEVSDGVMKFLTANAQLMKLAHNDENRLMSAEMLVALPRPVPDNIPALEQLEKEVRHLGVPKESSLGVASILLLGQRGDGSFATANLPPFLQLTRSFESAALLAIMNEPIPDLAAKFNALRSMFAGWGFAPSEDVELSSAYLTLSELPADGVSTKLAILVRGLASYLQYPLVASSILASVPVLEANDTLNLLEKAYQIIGGRAMPATEPELICLGVRMVHGIRTETVRGLDTTATAKPVVPGAPGTPYYVGSRVFFGPMVVMHGAYYSTFSGVGGFHPAHSHVGMGGAVGGGAGGG
jgi:hypothetical protein